MSEALFAIEDLSIDSKRGGIRQRIVDRASLSVAPGELYGLVGESGSGKSISVSVSLPPV
jgi:ABC-type glutathione transport system ATPase component